MAGSDLVFANSHLSGKCGKRLKRSDACGQDAIDFEQKEGSMELEVGSIILATGYEQFDPSVIPQYGHGKYDNVITGLEFETRWNFING